MNSLLRRLTHHEIFQEALSKASLNGDFECDDLIELTRRLEQTPATCGFVLFPAESMMFLLIMFLVRTRNFMKYGGVMDCSKKRVFIVGITSGYVIY